MQAKTHFANDKAHMLRTCSAVEVKTHERLSCAWGLSQVRAAAAQRNSKSEHQVASANCSGKDALSLRSASSKVMLVTALKQVLAPLAMHSNELAARGSNTILQRCKPGWSKRDT